MSTSILNTRAPDASRRKVMILSCPKTGNTWLRWLLHYAYRLPIVSLPLSWSDAVPPTLPPTFVTHQHLWPTEALVRWLVANDVAVVTTIRHPADTLLSYFHFAKWQDMTSDPSASAMRSDGDRPGKHALKFAKYSFAQSYSVSVSWARLGAHVVRYEDLLADPVAELRRLERVIGPLSERDVRSAVLLCQPEQMTRPGLVDPRHIRTGTARRWVREVPPEIADALAGMEPFKSACEAYGYDWDRTIEDPPRFDYASIDPFQGQPYFDNGEPIGPSLAKVFLHEVANAAQRWPDPTRTQGDSFWNWLQAPAAEGSRNPDFAPGTYTNLMAIVHRMRPDLQSAFPDPVGADRAEYLVWYLGRAPIEFEFPWGLMSPIMEAYCRRLGTVVREAATSDA